MASCLKDYGKRKEKTLFKGFVIKLASFEVTVAKFTFCLGFFNKKIVFLKINK